METKKNNYYFKHNNYFINDDFINRVNNLGTGGVNIKAKQRKVYNYIEQEQVLNKPWLSTEDLKIIVPLGINAINNFRKSIIKELEVNDEFYFKTRPILIPTKKVVEKLNIDVALIRREANKMRKGLI